MRYSPRIMQISPGTSLAHYEISEPLGKGGMGEVYRATDAKLGREVAIKILPDAFTSDAERLARFEREARVLASLNHSRIASIHGIEQADGTRFLVMELAEGHDLSDRIARGPIPVDETIEIAKQIAEALEVAHERGVVHRDLKPGNIKIDEEGNVKVLDFGLAKAMETEEGDEDFSDSPTIVKAATHAGVILGTAAYMSPEQARGKKVDKRADIWSFGVVLWEMLTGKQLFKGETVSDTLAAVLRQEIDWSELPDETPPAVRRVLRRCLVRKPKERQRDIGDVRLELESAGEESDSGGTTAVPRPGWTRALPWAIALLALIAATMLYFRPEPDAPPSPLRKFSITDRSAWVDFATGRPRISPDGKHVAYMVSEGILIRTLSRLDPKTIPDSAGARVAFWSPDSQWLGFVRGSKVFKVPAEGGPPSLVGNIPTELGMLAGAWGANDRIVLAQWRGGLWEISARGGTAELFLPANENLVDYHALAFLPDGETLLATPHLIDDSGPVELIRGTERKPLSRKMGALSYDPSGYVIHTEWEGNRGVWATPFSLESEEFTGEPFMLVPGGGGGDVSNDGTLIYINNAFENRGQLVRIDRSGEVVEELGEPAESLQDASLSPDGTRIVFTMEEADNRDLWILDLRRGTRTRVTFFPEEELQAQWSPDGTSLAFVRHLGADWQAPENGIFITDLASAGTARKITTGQGPRFLPEGSGLVYETFDVRAQTDLATIGLDDGAKPVIFLESEFETDDPAISPDGRFVVYESRETGSNEVFMTRFPSAEGKWQVSKDGGNDPKWSRDGKTIYYAHDEDIYQVAFTADPIPSLSVPEPFFSRAAADSPAGRAPGSGDLDISYWAGYEPMPDGESILAIRSLPPEDTGVIVVENWKTEFEK